jgi:hypothetical protein
VYPLSVVHGNRAPKATAATFPFYFLMFYFTQTVFYLLSITTKQYMLKYIIPFLCTLLTMHNICIQPLLSAKGLGLIAWEQTIKTGNPSAAIIYTFVSDS